MNTLAFRFTKGEEVFRVLAKTISGALAAFTAAKGFPPDEYELSLGF